MVTLASDGVRIHTPETKHLRIMGNEGRGEGMMVDGGELCSQPLLAIDCWVQRSDVQNIVNRLLVDIVAARPHNIMAFIYQWSAPPPMPDTQTKRGSCVARMLQQQQQQEQQQQQAQTNTLTCNDEEKSLVFDAFSGLQGFGGYTKGGNGERSPKCVRTEGPSVQELQSLYRDAKDSPYKLLASREEFTTYTRREHFDSLSCSQFNLCLGRGNYGFVIPALLKSALGGSTSGGEEEEGSVSDQGQNGCRDVDEALHSTGHHGVVAIKVSRVQGAWSLDEVKYLSRVKTARQQLEEVVQMLRTELAEYREQERKAGPHQQAKEDALSANEAKVHHLEMELKSMMSSLEGARLVVSLVGDVMYDVDRDSLLLPLEYYPSSLGDCIRARSACSLDPAFPCCSISGAVGAEKGSIVPSRFFSVQEVQHVARSLCRALHFIHTKCSICHLDVKVENILLSSPWLSDMGEALPLVVLSDLGLARPIHSPIVQLGDFSTMAPEVYSACPNGEHVKTSRHRTPVFLPSCDMWSVGCVLLHMVNGVEYSAWDQANMFAAMDENYVSPALQHPHLWPMEMNDFITRCFERDPLQRMQTEEALSHLFIACS